MPKHKFKKFERSEEKLKFRLGEGELKILQDLADYRFLHTGHLFALNPDLSARSIQRKLKLLFHAGYIDRPASQISYGEPSTNLIYAIGRKGAQLIFKDKRAESNWTRKNQLVKADKIQHELLISNFRVVLTLALKKSKTAKLSHWQTEGLRDNVYVRGESIPFSPDGYFTIKEKVKDGVEKLHFFLEADRGTMGDKKFLQKIKAYWQYWQEGRHKKDFGFNADFRVLTITNKQGRVDNLMNKTARAIDNEDSCQMFWFCYDKSFNLDNPTTILEPIWLAPDDEEFHYLLE